MSKIAAHRTYKADVATVKAAILKAGQDSNLKPNAASTEETIIMNETFALFSFGWPAKLTASISGADGAATVAYTVSNFGFGPVQNGRVKKVLGQVTSALARFEASA